MVPVKGNRLLFTCLFCLEIQGLCSVLCSLSYMAAHYTGSEIALSWSPGEGVLPIMAYTGRLQPKGVLFSGFRYTKWYGFHKLRYIKG